MNPSNKLLSDITAFRTYAKHLSNLGRRETLAETINRDMTMHLDRYPQLSKDIIKAFQQVHDFKIMPSMRSLQFAGDAILKNNARQYNCSFTNIDNTRKFSEILFLLLSGVGVGYSVQSRHINQLPKIGQPREEGVFKIHDSIIGWAQALEMLANAYFNNGIRPLFEYSAIRPKGSYLVTTGARAPGPEPLKYMLEQVELIFKKATNRKLRPIEVHDLICIVSDCVLAGGIRRAALICLFDRTDTEMLICKSGEWYINYPHRARANNSAVMPLDEVTKEEFDYIFDMCKNSGSGEPAFSWTRNKEWGFNPCVTGDTNILTKEGYKEIQTLIGINVDIWNGYEWSNVTPRITGENMPILEIKTRRGNVIKCTPYHKFYLKGPYKDQNRQTNSYTNADQLLVGDQLIEWVIPKGEDVIQDTITSIRELGIEKFVYCFNEPKNHTAVFNGIITGQCHEIALQSDQFCNLSTVNQTGIKNEKDFLSRVYSAALIGTVQASYTDFPYLSNNWKHVTEAEALIGVSFTGVADSPNIITGELLEKGAALVLEVNEKYAKKLGINLAARTTAVKPEGTSSCVLGSSSGIHARHAPYYARRVRMNKDDALAHYLKNTIPELVEDDKFSATGVVVTIPQESPKDSLLRGDESAIQLFKRTLYYNKNWVKPGHRRGDNYHNVSSTISVKDDEWEELREVMWKHRNYYSGISLLPFNGGTYQQAPFEEITKEQFEDMSKLVKEVDLSKVIEETDNTARVEQLACVGGVCEL